MFLSLPLLLHGLPGREGEAVGLADGGAGEGVAGTPRWDLGHGANKVRNPFPPPPPPSLLSHTHYHILCNASCSGELVEMGVAYKTTA